MTRVTTSRQDHQTLDSIDQSLLERPKLKQRHPSWLPQNPSGSLWEKLCRSDILRLINNYNFKNRQEPIALIPNDVDFEITEDWGLKWMVERQEHREARNDLDQLPKSSEATKRDEQDVGVAQVPEIPNALDGAIEENETSQKTLLPPGSTPVLPQSRDHGPLWLGQPGCEHDTAAYLEMLPSDYITQQPLPTEEEMSGEGYAVFVGKTIEFSNALLLQWLKAYNRKVKYGSREIDTPRQQLFQDIVDQAKGKGKQIEKGKVVNFIWLLKHQRNTQAEIRCQEDKLTLWWRRYLEQCLATDTDIDPEVVLWAKINMALKVSNGVEREKERRPCPHVALGQYSTSNILPEAGCRKMTQGL